MRKISWIGFSKKNKLSLFLLALGVVGCSVATVVNDQPRRETRSISQAEEFDYYNQKIQPIFNHRCVACHSCLESPCQLNLQSYEGLSRGGIKNTPVYDGARLRAVKPTRLYEDALTTEEWREKGFHDVIGRWPFSILIESINMASQDRQPPVDKVEERQVCVKDLYDYEVNSHLVSKLAMPYGLAAISEEDQNIIKDWVKAGAPPPPKREVTLPGDLRQLMRAWESFLNKKDIKSKLVARYMYEHLFLAHFYDKNHPRDFFKLVRSLTSCERGAQVIATRKPNEAPPVADWFYCFVRDPAVVVDKTHIPYEFSMAKLGWIDKNFFGQDWTARSDMSFRPEIASNPFKAFKDIPVRARYQFLLKDAQYHIMTFIKGPVCNGTNAVNSIQEQFYTLFMSPESDLMSLSPEYSHQIVDQLILPGLYGSKVSPTQAMSDYADLVKNRNKYRQARGLELQKVRPQGLTLNDIWDGDGTNDNAILTIIRNDDNSRVVKGAFGDLSKTVFVLDYGLFERLVYNLVVNFDVYGNVGHQYLTRAYMDLLRMEAENNFLDFLPEEQRLKLKKFWYQGFWTSYKLKLFDEIQFSPIPEGIRFANPSESQLEFVRRVLFERMNARVRGPVDTLNWKKIMMTRGASSEEDQLRKITSVREKFARFFSEVTFLVVTENKKPMATYSILHNREHKNLSWILGESFRLSPEEDTLMVGRGYYSSYPNQFMTVERRYLPQMMEEIQSISTERDYDQFIEKYGIDRMDPKLWQLYDFMVEDYRAIDPVHSGYLDLSRYNL